MKNLRQHVARIAREYLDAYKSAMGIESPSRVFANLRWDKLEIDGKPWPPSPPLPWYSTRAPGEVYESPELRAAARRVRRLIRRHWYAVLFEPDSPIGASVQAAMMHPPKSIRRESVSLFDAVQQLEALGVVPELELLPGIGRMFEDELRRADEKIMKSICGVKLEGDT